MAALAGSGGRWWCELPDAGARWVATECRAARRGAWRRGRFRSRPPALGRAGAEPPCSGGGARRRRPRPSRDPRARSPSRSCPPRSARASRARSARPSPASRPRARCFAAASPAPAGRRRPDRMSGTAPGTCSPASTRAMRDGVAALGRGGQPAAVHALPAVLAARRAGPPAPRVRRRRSRSIEQLQGYEAAVDAWESAILPARVAGYQRRPSRRVVRPGRGRLRPARPPRGGPRRAARRAEAARRRRRRPRSACSGAKTSTGSSPPHGTGRCPSRRASGPPSRSSRPCGATARCSSPTSAS